MTDPDRRSDAVGIYLGRGLGPTPESDPQRLIDAFGDDGLDLVPYVEALLHELWAVPIDWTVETLASGTVKAVDAVAVRHPELQDDALEALRWTFGYNSR